MSMTSWLWVLATLGWIAGWIWLGAAYTAGSEGNARIARLATLCPAFAVLTCLVTFAAVPDRGSAMYAYTLWAHHTSFGLLFLFLVAAEYLQVEAWWKLRRLEPMSAVATTYRRLWALTETVPAPVAIVIFLTGLRLIWEVPERHSLSEVWLLCLVAGFSLFFWDGMFGYRRVVRLMSAWAERAEECGEAGRGVAPLPRIWTFQLAAHALSWPPMFLLGAYRWNPPNPMQSIVAEFEEQAAFLPAGWPQLMTALTVWVLVGVLLQTVRMATRFAASYSRRRIEPNATV